MNLSAEFTFREILMQEGTTPPKDWKNFDVFLSSGYNAKVLKEKIDKPIITIEPGISDILLALSKAVVYDETPVLISFQMDFSVLKSIEMLLAVKMIVEPYTKTDQEVMDIILKHKSAGRKCIVGSGMVCDLAEKAGMQSVFLYAEESLVKYIKIAADLAVSIQTETFKNVQLASILNNSNSGILFADNTGMVFQCNPSVAKYLNHPIKEIVGRSIAGLLPADLVNDILTTTKTQNIICQIDNNHYVIKVIPISSMTVITNFLLYIDDVHSVQKAERDIRRETLIQKGFIAKNTFREYHTDNSEFKRLLSIAKKVALSDESVVILGETGVGKELLAQSIHNYSKRASKAFVAVNCASISENLLESELFGYNEGAFTGAKKGGKEGLFEMAHLGTIFLDEIGEIGPALQIKLLRVIQEKQVLRIGGTKLIPFDARIIVATNRNLWEQVQHGKFREDLYYRLNVLELEIPPLRNHPEDIINLFAVFMEEFAPHGILSMLRPYLNDIERTLCSYDWPGNVRELENFVRMMVVFLEKGDDADLIIDRINDTISKKLLRLQGNDKNAPTAVSRNAGVSRQGSFICDQEQEIQRVLKICRGNYSKAAQMLGIHRVTLWRKLKQFEGLEHLAKMDS